MAGVHDIETSQQIQHISLTIYNYLGSHRGETLIMLADKGMPTPHETEIEQELNVNNVIRELEAIKANNGGKMPYGTISKVVKAWKAKIAPMAFPSTR